MKDHINEFNVECINEMAKEAMRIADEHGFNENTPGEDIALMHSELSEALEDIRAGKPIAELMFDVVEDPRSMNKGKPCGVPSELADCVIRILHFSARHGIDIGRAIEEKMMFNETRPYKHGGKKL